VPPPVGTVVCSACAAAVRRDAKACAYCGAPVVLPPPKGADGPAERKTFCPRCGELYPSDAARCVRCPPGATDERGGRCPRCAGTLSPSALGRATIDRCGDCHGVWFDGDELEHTMDLTTRGVSSREAATLRTALPSGSAEGDVRYLACVRCSERMARRQVAPRAGIVVDLCRTHGVWFDGGEMEGFAAFVRAGGLEVARHDGVAEVERRRRNATRAGAGSAPSDRLADSLGPEAADLGVLVAHAVSRLFRTFG
jgi:Zn-finger nucleic acid-binding protein